MKLLELQRRMAADIMQPLTARDHLARKTKAGYIKPSARLTSRERLEIYSRSYWYRLIDSLYEDFPGLRTVVGEADFDRLVRAYLAECPSRSFTMRDLGSRLEAWLWRNPKHGGANPALACDMARLEWAHIEVWDGLAERPLSAAELADIGPETRLGLQPHVRLLDLQFPVDELRVAITRNQAAACQAAPQLRRKRAQPRFIAVHRSDLSVFYKLLEPAEFAILKALREGSTLAGSIETAFAEQTPDGSRIQGWFAAWARLGWVTHSTGETAVWS